MNEWKATGKTMPDPSKREKVTLYEALAAKGMMVGSLVQSIAGHDYGRLAVIIEIEPPFAQIIDGKYRPAAKPKRKRLTHLRVVAQLATEQITAALQLPDAGQRDSAIRRMIREYLESLPAVVPGAPENTHDHHP